MKCLKLYVFFMVTIVSLPSEAHEVRPAFLHLSQNNDSVYTLLWKVPARGEAIPKIYPVLPDTWHATEMKSAFLPGHLNRTYKLLIPESVQGSVIRIDGLERTLIDVLLKIDLISGESYTQVLKPDQPSYTIPTVSSSLNVIKTYFVLGVEHIWFGIDHLLFVLALVLLTTGTWKLVKTITAFTIAHSITLSLAVLGFVEFPSKPVEAVIALSILFLAIELIHVIQGRQVTTAKYPWIVAFAFGLLHGFGFAGALSEIGLPVTDIPIALAFFNVGVEVGQLAFVIVALAVLYVINKIPFSKPLWLQKIPAYMIGSVAAMWTIERVLSFFP